MRWMDLDYIVDKEGTRAYSDIYNQPCDCIYCKNYYQAFSAAYPEIVELLHEFGVNIERPLEVIESLWNPTKDKRLYESYYSIKGELYRDKISLYSKDAFVTLYQLDTDTPIYTNTGMEVPYFIASVSNLQLPWVLSEFPED